jgi:hypothetical protein
MKKITALRSFSSHHGGTFNPGESKTIPSNEADMLIDMGFAQAFAAPPLAPPASSAPTSKPTPSTPSK